MNLLLHTYLYAIFLSWRCVHCQGNTVMVTVSWLQYNKTFFYKHTHAHACKFLMFVCDFLQEVLWVTNLFHWPLGICCSSLMAKPRREEEPPRARVMSSHRQSRAWAPSHTVHFHIVEGSSVRRFPLFVLMPFQARLLVLQNQWNWLVK